MLKVFTVFLTIVYFILFFKIIQWIFRYAFNPLTDILSLVCVVIAFIASVGLADFTVKKIREL